MRSVENKLTTIPLSSGMNESSGKRSGSPALYRVQNARIRSSGTMQKRCGTAVVTGETYPADEHSFVSGPFYDRPTEHPCFIASTAYQKLAGTTAGDAFSFNEINWLFAGAFSSVLPVSARTTIAGNDGFTDLGTELPKVNVNTSGYTCTAAYMQSPTALRVTVVNPQGKTIYSADTAIVTRGGPPRVVRVGTAFQVLWEDTSVGLRGQRISIAAEGVASPGAPATITAVSGFWDASSYDDTNWLLVYGNSPTDARVAVMADNGFVDVESLTVASDPYLSVWADPVTERVWVGIVNDPLVTNELAYAGFSISGSTLTSVLVQTVIATGVPVISPPLLGPSYSAVTPTSITCVYTTRSGSSPGLVTTLNYRLLGPTGTIGALHDERHLAAISKPDSKQRVWCAVSQDGAQDEYSSPFAYVLVRLEDAAVTTSDTAAIIEASTGLLQNIGAFSVFTGNGLANDFHEVATYGDELSFAVSIPVATMTDRDHITGNIQPTLQARVYTYSEETHRDTELSDARTLVVAGQPTVFGGSAQSTTGSPSSAGAAEIGFAHPPVIITATSAAGVLAAGSYGYVAVMQWADADGNRHLGQPSTPVILAPTVASQNTIVVAYTQVGQRIAESIPATLLYRTVDGGQNYQLVPLQPTISAGTATFVDNIADSIIAENEFLYTDGGVLPNVLAPTCRFFAKAEDRLWCGGLWDPTILEASKVRVPGEPWNFTGDPTHQVVLPEACTGIAYMDGQVVAFSAAAIYLVGGDGPNDQGAGGFLPPRMLTRGIGCIDYRSVLETPIGILFQSRVGIYLLPRGFGAPQYIGMPIQDTITTYTQVLSAAFTVSSEYNLARFLIGDADDVYSPRLVTLDIDSGQWFLDEYRPTGTASDVVFHSFSEIGAWPDGLALCRYELKEEASPIWAEDETVFADAGAAEVSNSTVIQRSVQTTWIYPFGVAGWGKVNKSILSMDLSYPDGVETGTASITLAYEIDSEGTLIADTWSFAGVSTDTGPYRGFDHRTQRLTCIRATITDNSAGRGPKFIGLTFELEPDGGIRMLTDTERS